MSASPWPDAWARKVALIARLNKHMRRADADREPNRELGLSIRLFGGMAIHDLRGCGLSSSLAQDPRGRGGTDAFRAKADTAEQTNIVAMEPARERAGARLAAPGGARTAGNAGLDLEPNSDRRTSHAVDGPARRCGRRARRDQPRRVENRVADVVSGRISGGSLRPRSGLRHWLEQERRRLVAIARMAGEAFLDERHAGEEIIAAARSLLRVEPAHDGAWRALIQAHVEAGDRAAARFACERWREAAGVAPGEPVRRTWPRFCRGCVWTRIFVRWRQADHRRGRERSLNGSCRTGSRKTVSARRTPPGRVRRGIVTWGVASPEMPAPERMVAWGEGRGDERGSHPAAASSRRSSLRLGIREMRVIGPNVDQALSPGLAEEVTTALSRFRWISCVSGSSLAAIAGETGGRQSALVGRRSGPASSMARSSAAANGCASRSGCWICVPAGRSSGPTGSTTTPGITRYRCRTASRRRSWHRSIRCF